MFKVGDKVILKYPENDSYDGNNAAYGIDNGILALGSVYVVVKECSPYVTISGDALNSWTISPECFVRFGTSHRKRLPDWW